MQLTLGSFKGLRYAGALLLLTLGSILGITYWHSVSQHQRYLASRNFRLLTVLATQTQSVIDGQGRIFSTLLADATNFETRSSPDTKATDTPGWLKAPLRFIPGLQHVDLTDIRPVTKPVWARGRLAATAGDSLFVLCEPTVMEAQIRGASALNLGPIVRSADPEAEWRRALMQIDRTDGDRAMLVPDLDKDLDNPEVMRRKLALPEELVEDPARTVVVLSETPLSVLNDSVRRDSASPGPDRERWERIRKAFVVLDWRDAPDDAPPVDMMVEDPHPSGWRSWAARLSLRRWRLTDRRPRTSEKLLAHEGARISS